MLALLKKFLKSDEGLETVEYAIMASLITLGAILAITALGGKVTAAFEALNAKPW